MLIVVILRPSGRKGGSNDESMTAREEQSYRYVCDKVLGNDLRHGVVKLYFALSNSLPSSLPKVGGEKYDRGVPALPFATSRV